MIFFSMASDGKKLSNLFFHIAKNDDGGILPGNTISLSHFKVWYQESKWSDWLHLPVAHLSELSIFFNNEPRRQRRPFKPPLWAAFLAAYIFWGYCAGYISGCVNSARHSHPQHSLTQGWGATARDIKTEFAASTAHHLGPKRHSHIQISSRSGGAHSFFQLSSLSLKC